MIYLDTSVVLAELFAETKRPPASLWREQTASSRLLEYETLVRINAREQSRSFAKEAAGLIERVALLELAPVVLARALEPFPTPVRTLDAIHLASMHYLQESAKEVVLASYDDRLLLAAKKLGFRAYL